MIPVDDAEKQATVLLDAAEASPVRTIRALLRARGQEWKAAAKWYREATEDGDDPIIVPAATIQQGCSIYWGGVGSVEVVRVSNGGTGLFIKEPGVGPYWENRMDPASPVVLL